MLEKLFELKLPYISPLGWKILEGIIRLARGLFAFFYELAKTKVRKRLLKKLLKGTVIAWLWLYKKRQDQDAK